MAQVRPGFERRDRIDRYLENLVRTWESIPLDAQEWDEWDDLSQLTYVTNWSVYEDQLHQLQRWAEQGLLTPTQCTRYDELLKLVAKNRPVLEKLLED